MNCEHTCPFECPNSTEDECDEHEASHIECLKEIYGPDLKGYDGTW